MDSASHSAGTIFAGKIRRFDSVLSTNTLALEAAQQGAPEGTVLVADQQTAGRGRGGHQWESAAGVGLYCSVILRPSLEGDQWLLASLMAGLAAQSAIENECGLAPELRWPNDLLVGQRKLAGILADAASEQGRLKYLVIGIGINVNQALFPPQLQALATSLRIETGREWPREALLEALLQSLDREYRALTAVDGARELLRRFELRSSYARGRRVQVDEQGGYEGVTDGLDERGFLRVMTEDGVRMVLSGGVRALDAADKD